MRQRELTTPTNLNAPTPTHDSNQSENYGINTGADYNLQAYELGVARGGYGHAWGCQLGTLHSGTLCFLQASAEAR